MRTTSLATAVALLILGCGIDPSPTAPEDAGLTSPEPGLTLPEPELSLPEPEFAAAVATTNVGTTEDPMPTARSHHRTAPPAEMGLRPRVMLHQLREAV